MYNPKLRFKLGGKADQFVADITGNRLPRPHNHGKIVRRLDSGAGWQARRHIAREELFFRFDTQLDLAIGHACCSENIILPFAKSQMFWNIY